MNIGIVLPKHDGGDVSRHAGMISRVLARKNSVYTLLFEGDSVSSEFGGDIIDLSLPDSLNRVGTAMVYARRASAIKKAVKKYSLDVIIIFTRQAATVCALSSVKCRKYFFFSQEEDDKKSFSHTHSLAPRFDGIVFTSDNAMRGYTEKYPHDAGKCRVIPKLFDVSQISAAFALSMEYDYEGFYCTHRVLATSLPADPSGLDLLLSAFDILKKSIPDAGLVLIGYSESLFRKIRAKCKKSNYSDDILFLGYHSNPYRYISKCGVFVSLAYPDEFPEAMLTAMCSFTPVIALGGGAADEILQPEGKEACGVSVSPDSESLALAIKNLFSDGELAKSYCEKAYARAADFDAGVIEASLSELLK